MTTIHNLSANPLVIDSQSIISGSADSAVSEVKSKGTPISESGLLVDISSQIGSHYLNQVQTPEQAKVALLSVLKTDRSLGTEVQRGLDTAIHDSKGDSVTVIGPASSRWSDVLMLLIKASNDSAIASNTLSAKYGTMSETSSKAAASAQMAQGLSIMSKSIISSGINIGTQAAALHGSTKNYQHQKVNIQGDKRIGLEGNLKGMHERDVKIRELQNVQDSVNHDVLVKNTADVKSGNKLPTNNDAQPNLEAHHDQLTDAHKAAVKRDLDIVMAERNDLQAAYNQGDNRYQQNRAKIETQRAIGVASAGIADGTGSTVVSNFQKEETLERAEAKVLDSAVEMTRQSAEKSAKLLADMMSMMEQTRRMDQELGASVAGNIKA